MQHWLSPTLLSPSLPFPPSLSFSLSVAIAISVCLHCSAKVYLICVRRQRCWWLFRQGRRGLTDTPTIHAYKNNKYWFDDVRQERSEEKEEEEGSERGLSTLLPSIFANAFNHFGCSLTWLHVCKKAVTQVRPKPPSCCRASCPATPRQRLHCAKNSQETFAYLTSLSIVVKLEFLNILQANWHKKSCKVVKFGLTLQRLKEFQSVLYLYLSKRRLKTIEGCFKVMLIILLNYWYIAWEG